MQRHRKPRVLFTATWGVRLHPTQRITASDGALILKKGINGSYPSIQLVLCFTVPANSNINPCRPPLPTCTSPRQIPAKLPASNRANDLTGARRFAVQQEPQVQTKWGPGPQGFRDFSEQLPARRYPNNSNHNNNNNNKLLIRL